jgi:hypothetical protein
METRLIPQVTVRAMERRRNRYLTAVLWLGLFALLFALSR